MMSWVHVYCTVSGGAGHSSQIDENQEYLLIHVASKFISGWKEGEKAKVWNLNVNWKSNGSFICCFIRCCPCWHSMKHEIQPESLPSCQKKKIWFHTFFNQFTHFDYCTCNCHVCFQMLNVISCLEKYSHFHTETGLVYPLSHQEP